MDEQNTQQLKRKDRFTGKVTRLTLGGALVDLGLDRPGFLHLAQIKGEPVKLFVYDTRGENSEAVNLTRKLIHVDKVVAIVGPLFSAECEVAFPLAVQGKTPIVR